MRLGFNARAINERGMSIALQDYACAAQSILGHDVTVFYDEAQSNPAVVERFARTLRMVPYDGASDFRVVSEPHALDFCYFITPGWKTNVIAAAERVCVHAVFRHFEPHGDVYAYISDWLADWMTSGAAPAVPHIVDMPKPKSDMRDQLGLSRDAFVVGRYGGYDQFNVPFAPRAVAEALDVRANLHFVFVNTQPFINHPRVRFLDAIVDPQQKADFISTCDIGLNAKKIGESFGLAIAEFLALGKPCLAWAGGLDQNHVHMIPDKRWLYRTRRDLVHLLGHFRPSEQDRTIAHQAVAGYATEPVIRRFESVFIAGPSNADLLTRPSSHHAQCVIREKLMRLKFSAWKHI